MKDSRIDAGNDFDWGRTSEDYARYRDIYPQAFYDRILARRLCISEQTTLDLGTGTGESMKPILIPEAAKAYFNVTHHEEYKLSVPFTRETWHGRMRACRGVGASLGEAELAQWDRAYRAFLQDIAPERFDVLHYAALTELKGK